MIKLPLLVAFVFLLTAHQRCDGRGPYFDHPICPRRQHTTESGRPCPRKCGIGSNLNCKANNRRCECQGVCGMSCVKTRKNRCGPVSDIENGSWELVTSSMSVGRHSYRLGSVIRYSCDEGYALYGTVQRVCQADGTWSDATPSCRVSEMPAWSSRRTKRCQSPPVVRHARYNASTGRTSFPLGTQLVYRCRRGYSMDGPLIRVICVDEGRWAEPQTTCSPRSCGHPDEIVNGVRNGSEFTYKQRVIYTCLRGFKLVGRRYRVCQHNGEWSGQLPTCKPIACQELSAPDHGHVISGDEVPTFGSTVTFGCDTGYQLRGFAARTCLPNGTWSGSPAVCERMNCGHPGNFPNGIFVGEQNTTVGSIINFRCMNDDMQSEGEFRTKCLPNGTWSNPIPKCWSPCRLPDVAAGFIVAPLGAGLTVPHGSALQYDCDEGFQPQNSTTTCCHNGTWLTIPVCVPAMCKGRPNGIKNAIVRYHHRRHGAIAIYECNFGFNMVGNSYLECRHGNWTNPSEVQPECQPNTCEYPGNITHGRVLLVGHIGKYEYRQYVQPVGHNDHIQYECFKHYRLVGPSGSTCVNGTWSPPQLPRCEPKHHPDRYYLYPDNQSFDGQLRRASVSSRRPFWATV